MPHQKCFCAAQNGTDRTVVDWFMIQSVSIFFKAIFHALKTKNRRNKIDCMCVRMRVWEGRYNFADIPVYLIKLLNYLKYLSEAHLTP